MIKIANPVPSPPLQRGAYGAFKLVITTPIGIGGGLFSRTSIPQVIGLIPVFLCDDTECRTGKFIANRISDDHLFPLPVFAEPSGIDLYFNDKNSWLFELPSSGTQTMTFKLDKLSGNNWVETATLNNDAYGVYYPAPSGLSPACVGGTNDGNPCVTNADCPDGTCGENVDNTLCNSKRWTGIKLDWQKVLNGFGEGMYRFRVVFNLYHKNHVCIGGINDGQNCKSDGDCPSGTCGLISVDLCLSSPPFCLKVFDCYQANRTTKFESYYSGGKFGSVSKKDCGGSFWEFCCCTSKVATENHQICIGGTNAGKPCDTPTSLAACIAAGGTCATVEIHNVTETICNPIAWYDSIRIFGFFGREEKTKERNQIKYQTGVVKKIRDEAIRKFKWSSFGNSAANPGSGLPFWFHDRFSVYGLMADQLLVSDYNINNSDYGLKRYCVIDDSDYAPKYKGESRYSNVEIGFKSQSEYLTRTRCC